MWTPRTISIPCFHRPGLGTSLWLLLAVGVAGCGGTTKAPPAATPTATAESTDKTPRATGNTPPAKSIDLKHPIVQIDTNLGTIKIRLDAENAPITVSNFQNYVNEGFYKNVIFHYVAPGKMIVGGGYSAERELKPGRTTVRNEAHNGRKNVRGTIAMARDSALRDSGSTQFFINLEDAPQRDYKGDTPEEYGYCVFGDVIEGLDVAERISQSPTIDLSERSGDLAQTPKTPVVISAIRVVM